MAKKNKTAKSAKESINKVSYHYRPDNMTLQEWQIALRRQAAMKRSLPFPNITGRSTPAIITWSIP